MAKSTASYSLTVPLQDIDAAGVVFFAHLFRYAHEAYEHWMADQGLSLRDILAEGRYLLPLVHAEADYRQPLRHGEQLHVQLSVNALGDTSFTLGYQIIDEAGQSRAQLETVHVVLDAATHTPTPVPEALRMVLGGTVMV